MSTKFSESFNDALLKFIQSAGEMMAVKVVDFEEETIEWGGCETCSYTETIVEITWEDSEGEKSTFKYSGYFVDLVRALTDDDTEEEED